MNDRRRWKMYKALLQPEKFFFDLFTFREMFQWVIVVGVVYLLVQSFVPGDITIKAILVSFIFCVAWFFIHYKVGNLAGLEWILLWLRDRMERPLHMTYAPDIEGVIAPPPVTGSIRLSDTPVAAAPAVSVGRLDLSPVGMTASADGGTDSL